MKYIRYFLLVVPLLFAFGCTSQILDLTKMDLTSMSSGWGQTKIDSSITSNPLTINGEVFATGIGTHATSTFLIDLGGKSQSFSARVGVDDASDTTASIQFMVLGDQRILWESPVMKKGDPALACEVSLKGINQLGLLVADGGDGMDYDHANWIEPQIKYRGLKPDPAVAPVEDEYILTPEAPKAPRISGAPIWGARPGAPIIFRIPATGEAPMEFEAENLPAGLSLGAGDRIIKGSVSEPGDYTITLKAKNIHGEDAFDLILRIGDTLALTPHMGWNSWYIHYHRVSDAIMREAADQMIATGMADYGYRYVNIDDCWMVKVDSDDPEIGGPVRDQKNELLTNKRFPDMKGMTDYIHAQGLLAGTYISPGPSTCAGYAGSWQHEAQDARTFANWGFDFLKYDWCSYSRVAGGKERADYVRPYDLMWGELKKQKRDIVLNLCQYGMNQVWEWGGNVGNSWRTTGDLGLHRGGSMPGFYSIGRSNADHWQYARPGNWNDPDYILIGWVASAFVQDMGVKTTLTPSEQYFYMSMWSLMAAPLIFSGDMAKLDPFTLNVLCNHEVIAVNQDVLGVQGRIIRESEEEMVMVKPLSDGSLAVGLFHVTGKKDSPADYFDWGVRQGKTITVTWEELGLTGEQTVRDLWRQQDLDNQANGLSLEVPWHGVQMLRISAKN